MSGHRRVKDIDYDEDGLDSYEEDHSEEEGAGELSVEDKEQMRQNTILVKEALGDEHGVSEQAIQEALWHYYYDVAKSVAYLKNQHTPKQPKKPKQESRFDRAAAAATPMKASSEWDWCPEESAISLARPLAQDHYQYGAYAGFATQADTVRLTHELPDPYPLPGYPLPEPPPYYFSNVPPGALLSYAPGITSRSYLPDYVPVRRTQPRGPLLGGSASTAKPSKLAALAAARKKKDAEQKAAARTVDEGHKSSVSLLDRLAKKDIGAVETREENKSWVVTQAASTSSYPLRRKRDPSPVRTPPTSDAPQAKQPEEKPQEQTDLRAMPSIFAQTICFALPRPSRVEQKQSDSMPYLSCHDYATTTVTEVNRTKSDFFAGPSPDDVVLNAQAKASSSKSKQAPSKKPSGPKSEDGTNGVTNGVEKLSVEDTIPQRTRSKNLDIPALYASRPYKPSASFVVIGHVDHGKSTLMGRLLYDLKVVDQRSVDKLRREATNTGKGSFALAWVMDSTSEERERGVTVDIAMNHFETSKCTFTILDAPGHKDFVPNMIAGASQADFAVLVIDASTNAFESGLRGQTKEHALLVRSAGVRGVVVAVNKMDACGWNKERFEEIRSQIGAFLSLAGFKEESVVFVPCAGLTGENVVHSLLPCNTQAGWWHHGPLVSTLETQARASGTLDLRRPFRLQVSDVFRGGITNPLSVSGKVEQGAVQAGDVLLAQPASQTACVKAIEIDNEAADYAVAGQIATLHLTDIEAQHLRSGDILCDPTKAVKNITTFTAKVLAFEALLPQGVDVHRGRLHVPGRVKRLLAVLDKGTGQVVKKQPRVVQAGAVARVSIEFDGEVGIPLEVGNRVVLRNAGETIAAGLIEGVS
ncbi:hypothetical protein LTR66_000616 [Elasticomyces elasticus]|nr:hypothetical protein LTR66_000616 [Elasticomyces elasticus]